jgi:ribosome-associated protein
MILLQMATDDIPDRGEDLRVTSSITLPAAALRLRYVRGRGPGGQNVNKVSSAAELIVHQDAIRAALGDEAFGRFVASYGTRITSAGDIQISSDEHRTQENNRRAVLDRLLGMLRQSLVRPKTRRKTKPSRGSKMRRLEGKKRRGEIKAMRRGMD